MLLSSTWTHHGRSVILTCCYDMLKNFLQCRHHHLVSTHVLFVSSGLFVRGDAPLLHPHHPVCHPMEIFLEVSEPEQNRFLFLKLVHKAVARWHEGRADSDGDWLLWSNIWITTASLSVQLLKHWGGLRQFRCRPADRMVFVTEMLHLFCNRSTESLLTLHSVTASTEAVNTDMMGGTIREYRTHRRTKTKDLNIMLCRGLSHNIKLYEYSDPLLT